MILDPRDHLAAVVTEAIQAGRVDALVRLLDENSGLATARFGSKSVSRSLLHVATDWPGNFPNGQAVVAALVEAGAEVDARFVGPHTETALHWAASNDDVAVLDTLLDLGADIEAGGAVIGGGTPLADAVAFGNWRAARRLVERGAVANLWQAAALGMSARVDELCATDSPTAEEVTGAFWCACHGGQRETAESLLGRGADINWIGWDDITPLDAAVRSGADEFADWLRAQGAVSAT